MSVDTHVKTTTPATGSMPVELVEQIVYAARHRWYADLRRARQIADFRQQCERTAVVYDRIARWWGVLARYCPTFTPYLTAIFEAQVLAEQRAENNRHRAATVAQLDIDAQQRATDSARERVA